MNDIFVVSDLHVGDQGPRDNFYHMNNGHREQEFKNFLAYVWSHKGGRLIIAGDLFELWQSNISEVMTCRPWLLKKLGEMEATYQLGNHDADLKYFAGKSFLYPYMFGNMTDEDITLDVGGKRILITHGHKQDPYCASDVPGIGRISAIYAGIREDRNGSPLVGKYGSKTVEARSLGHWDRLSRCCRRLIGKPSATQEHRQAMCQTLVDSEADALIYGHTHEPGQFYHEDRPLPIYNAGTWAEKVNTFVHIKPDGTVLLKNWYENCTVANTDRLQMKL
jgi:UDP-2,3-diacylglucosamine pyrophosphatase LpxH